MSSRTPDYSTYPVAALIREAPLKTNEKVLLFVIASHKHEKSFATAEKLFRQTGLGRTTFYLVRTSLRDRGILGVREAAAGAATTYTIRREALEKLIRSANRGLSANGTPLAVAKHTEGVARRHGTLPSSDTESGTSSTNSDDILNLKPSDQQRADGPDRPMRRARPTRRSTPPVARAAPDDGRDALTKAAALRSRMHALRDRDV